MSEITKALLRKAILTQNQLNKIVGWKDELLHLAPPVLWFGTTNNSKPKIITLGANPSRSEFLDGNNTTLKNIKIVDVPYLNRANQRFYTFKKNEVYDENDVTKLDKIIESYNNYFTNNPYKKWFGDKNGGKVEALVNGFNGSFYDAANKQAIHLDLFPFATLRDYSLIKHLPQNDLFKNGWAQTFLLELINFINTEVILVFGISNFNIFNELFKDDIIKIKSGTFKNSKGNNHTTYHINEFKKFKLVGLTINVGNPMGFSREDLKNLSKQIKTQF